MPLTLDNAKAYATDITGGKATYAKAYILEGMDAVRVRVRLPSYRVAWVDVWIDPVIGIYGEW